MSKDESDDVRHENSEAEALSETATTNPPQIRTNKSQLTPESSKPAIKRARNRKWPFDAAVTIAILALLISVLQLILNTPILIDHYLRPTVVVTNVPNNSNANIPIVGFRVENTGRASAQDVEIGITSFGDDKISVTPQIGATVTHNDLKLYRLFRVTIPYLAPNEFIVIVIDLKDERHKLPPIEIKLDAPDGGSVSARAIVPSISYARSRSGPGKVLATRFDFVPVSTKTKRSKVNSDVMVVY